METKYLILVSGKMRTGKNAFADMFEQECKIKNYSVKIDSYAMALKTMCSEEFGSLISYLNDYTKCVKENIPMFGQSRLQDMVSVNLFNILDKVKTTPENWFENKNDITRLILQIMGTNIFRKYVDDDYWIKVLLEKIKDYNEKYVLITDARFPNEIDLPHKLVENRTVISIRVSRNFISDCSLKTPHASEIALDKYDWFDYEVDNNGSLETLKDSARTILSSIQIEENL